MAVPKSIFEVHLKFNFMHCYRKARNYELFICKVYNCKKGKKYGVVCSLPILTGANIPFLSLVFFLIDGGGASSTERTTAQYVFAIPFCGIDKKAVFHASDRDNPFLLHDLGLSGQMYS